MIKSEQIFKEEFLSGMVEANYERFKEDFPTLLKCIHSAINRSNGHLGWISVNDKLPERDTWVLGYSVIAFKHSWQMVVLFGQDSFHAKGFEIYHGDITHWKPLDEPKL